MRSCHGGGRRSERAPKMIDCGQEYMETTPPDIEEVIYEMEEEECMDQR